MPQFKVIRASAGSGKTFRLTGEYLRLLVEKEDAFMHILAVTFTNKATGEMKSRIIRELYNLASERHSQQLNGLTAVTGMTEKEIRSKAAVILKKLLHRYSWFSVNTIDSFFQRIIRSFTRELGIQEGYAIELDTEMVLTEIIDRLLIHVEQDKELLTWLTHFAESLIEKGESWNLRKGIRNLGKEIFREDFRNLNDASLNIFSDRIFLNKYRGSLYVLVQQIEKTYKEFGLKAIALLKTHGLSVEDFSMKNRGPAGFLVKLAGGSFYDPTATAIQAAISVEKWYAAASVRKAEIQKIAVNDLMPLMQQVIEFHANNCQAYHSASVILKNLYTLGILMDLSALADTWCNENNAFLLPEAPGFLNKIIDDNDTPFIYEKAGCWFHHFMIDEFQDTSIMQWLNFKPLISNSLSQNFDNLAVGDTKQSIYRWRNSSWEILEKNINQDFPHGIVGTVTLKENWRSRLNIILFNNRFFSSAAEILQDAFEQLIADAKDLPDSNLYKSINELYFDMEQVPGNPDNQGGYVHVEYIRTDDETAFYDTVNNKVVHLLYDLLSLGYHLNDIALLTRKNNEATRLADFLLKFTEDGKPRIDVISDEALRLGSSVVVNTLVALLKFMVDPNDTTNNYFIVSSCLNYVYEGIPDTEWIDPEGKENLPQSTMANKLPAEFLKLVSSVKSFSLIEITERIIKIFHFESHHGEIVYLMAFRDLILEYSKNFGSDTTRFLDFWFETGIDRSVSAPAGQDAVRILTLHKAKGLEFKIVIIPYCTWELNTFNKSYLWCKPASEPFNRLPVLPLTFTGQLRHTIFADDYYQEIQKQYIDNLNLLYVAFTRAQEAMYVFCKERDNDQLKTVSDLSGKVLGKTEFTLGSMVRNVSRSERQSTETIPYKPLSLKNISGRVKIAFQGKLWIDPALNKPVRPVNDGKILHEILSMVTVREDINPAAERLLIQGKIAADEKGKYVGLLENAMSDLQVSTWFTKDWQVQNEAEIILPKGTTKRPDRVMTRSDQTLIIDYKFGNRLEPAYEKQIAEYAAVLVEMGYRNVEAYLWYVRLGKVVQVKL